MNPITRGILSSILVCDTELEQPERTALQLLIEGRVAERLSTPPLLSQSDVAKQLRVSRVTVWRMAGEGILHPVQIKPGQYRYSQEEVATLSTRGWKATCSPTATLETAAGG